MASFRSNFGDLLEPGFRKIFDDAFKEMPLVFPKIMQVENSAKQDEKYSGATGFGLFAATDEGGQINYDDPVQMFDVTMVHVKYTKGFKVSEELVEDDMYNVIKGKPAQLGRAARRTVETINANILNRAFNSSYADGGDSKVLCSVSHTRSDGGTAQSNASSTGITFGDANLETGMIASREQLDDRGMRIQVMPNTLIGPINLEKEMNIVVNSTLRPGVADNDVNVYKGKFSIVAWEYITVNNTAWFLMDKSQAKLLWLWRIRPEFKQDVSFDTGMALFKSRFRGVAGWTDWRGFWGSLGDGSAYST
jgi:phage major head subunit gpT-like protein